VEIGRSSVEPIGWEPADVAYTAVVADVPLPPAAVAVDPAAEPGLADAVAAVETSLRTLVDTAGPGGGPSPHVRFVSASDPTTAQALRLRIAVPAPGIARIARADGTAVTTDVDVTTDGGARLLVCRLEHVARWEQVRALGGHPSPLAAAVVLDVFAAEPGEAARPADRLPVAASGGYELAYRRDDRAWLPPSVFMELRNTSSDDLYACVLDLTDRFRCHAVLPTVRLAAGHSVALWDGVPIPLTLPEDRPVEPGAVARDWLKVVVSDVDFDAAAFDLPELDEPEPPPSTTRSVTWSTLARVAARAVTRDIGGAPPAITARWAADTITFETTVPS
jgi:hypothetical protein